MRLSLLVRSNLVITVVEDVLTPDGARLPSSSVTTRINSISLYFLWLWIILNTISLIKQHYLKYMTRNFSILGHFKRDMQRCIDSLTGCWTNSPIAGDSRLHYFISLWWSNCSQLTHIHTNILVNMLGPNQAYNVESILLDCSPDVAVYYGTCMTSLPS